jgi:YesN/AraC family two-component response regulator
MNEGKKDEFHAIGRALDNLWDHSNQLQQENAKNLKFKREHQFRRLAEGRFETASFYGAKEEEMFGLQLERHPTAVLIEIDRYLSELSNLYPEHEIGLMKEAFQSSLDRRLADEGISYTTEWLTENQLGAIVMLEEGQEPEDRLEEVLENFRLWTEQDLPFTVTISVGVAVERIEAVSVSFQTARRALSYKVSLGLNRIITQNVLPDSEQRGMVQELQRIEEISRSLRVGERSWVHELQLFIRTLQTGSFNGEQVRNLLFVLLFHVQHKMSDLPAELESVWLKANSRLEMTMNKGETLSDIGLVLKETLEAVSGRIQEWRDSKNNRVIMQDIKRYIDEHYNDPNLSQSMLAEAFRLHPSSISRLFKEEYGVKFVDYVNSVRVEQAARLMGQGHTTVQDVAEQVGFVHSKTFISIFKKITGYTPGNYQKDRTGTEF